MEWKRCSTLLALAGTVWMLLALPGCHDPLAAEAAAARQQRARQVTDMYAQREADAPRRMRQTLDWADRIEQRHAERTLQNKKRIEEWLPDERLRWQANQPMYRRRIADQFAGHPERARWAFRAMFY